MSAEPREKRAKTTLGQLVAQLNSGTREGLAAALAALSRDAEALPPWPEYVALTEDGRVALHEASLVHAYLAASPAAAEVLAAAKVFHKHRASSQYRLCLALLRLLLDSNRFFDTQRYAARLVKKILSSELKAMHKTLAAREHKPCLAVIALLASMARTSAAACKDLMAVLHVSALVPLCKREVFRQERARAFEATQLDLPGAVTVLVVALLSAADAPTKQVLLTDHPLVSECMTTVSLRSNTVACELLQCLNDHVLSDRAVARRVKTHFFSAALLAQLGALLKRAPGSPLEQPLLELLDHLIADHHEGICFPETDWAPVSSSTPLGWSDDEALQSAASPFHLPGSRNRHLLPLLQSCKPWRSPVQQRVLVNVLRECPRLAPDYWKSLKDSFHCDHLPLNEWMSIMALFRTYCTTDVLPEPVPFCNQARVAELADRLAPPCPTAKQWRKMLLDERALVRLFALDSLTVLLRRCRITSGARVSPLVRGALEAVAHRLPPLEFVCVTLAAAEAKRNVADGVVLGALLRCVGAYRDVFEHAELNSWSASASPWSAVRVPLATALASCWACLPALQSLMGVHYAAWFHAKDYRFQALVRHAACAAEPVVRAQAGAAAASLLARSELFLDCSSEAALWTTALRSDEEAVFLAQCVLECQERPATPLAILSALCEKGSLAAAPSVSLLLVHACSKGAALPYVGRVLRSVAVSSVVGGVGMSALLYRLLKPHKTRLPTTCSYLRWMARGKSARQDTTALWEQASEQVVNSATDELALCVWRGLVPADEAILGTESNTQMLCNHATFYIGRLSHLLSPASMELCFALLARQQCLPNSCAELWATDAALTTAALTHASPASLHVIGQSWLRFATLATTVGAAVYARHVSPPLLPLASCLDWSLVDRHVLESCLDAAAAAPASSCLTGLLRRVWPSRASRLWLEQCWMQGRYELPAAALRSDDDAELVEPSQGALELIVKALLEPQHAAAAATVLLEWWLNGFPLSFAAFELQRGCLAATGVHAARALLVLLNVRAAEEVKVDNLATAVHLMPALLESADSGSSTPSVRVLSPWFSDLLTAVPAPWLARLALRHGVTNVGPILQSYLAARSPPIGLDVCLVQLASGSPQWKLELLQSALGSPSQSVRLAAWRAAAPCVVELPHIANHDDAGMRAVQALFAHPHDGDVLALVRTAVVEDARTSAGWVERACAVLLAGAGTGAVELFELLEAMLARRPNLRSAAAHQRVASWYGATCSRRDRVMLRILGAFDGSLVTLAWGPEAARLALDPRAAFYEGQLLTDHGLANSVANFPCAREDVDTEDSPYDPFFVLPYFRTVVLTRFAPNCRRFAHSGCLAFVLAACASRLEQVRQEAYAVIQIYSDQLSAATTTFACKPQIDFLLNAFRGAISRPYQCVPALAALVLAKWSVILCTPGHFLYAAVNDALLRAPVVDLETMPLFHELFLQSTAVTDGASGRRWFLQTVEQGVRRTMDLDLLQRVHVLDVAMSFHLHVADAQERAAIVACVTRLATRDTGVALKLERQHALVSWLRCVVDAGHCDWLQVASAALAVLDQSHESDALASLAWTLGWKLAHLATAHSAASATTSVAALALAVRVMVHGSGEATDPDLLLLLRHCGDSPHVLDAVARTTGGPRSPLVLEKALDLFVRSSRTCAAFLPWLARHVALQSLSPRGWRLVRWGLCSAQAGLPTFRRQVAALVVLRWRQHGVVLDPFVDDVESILDLELRAAPQRSRDK